VPVDLRERNALAERHMALVFDKARTLHGRLRFPTSDVTTEELAGNGMLGLLRAADRYEPGRGLQFATYASHVITGAMLDELRRSTRYHRSTKTPQPLPQSLDAPVFDGEATTVGDLLPGGDSPEDHVDALDIEVALGCLLPRERAVVHMYFWEGRSQDEIGKVLGVTGSRVCQLLARSRRKLRRVLA
jgi:RNA polymerase sigma factor FliA